MPITIQYTPPSTEPKIIHIDDDLIIVDKPAGLLSVPGRGDDKKDCLISRIQKKHPEALIIHRLDLPTSGILILARNPEIHRIISKQFEKREVSKEYTAVVEGVMSKDSGEINLPLITDWPNRPKQKVDFESGKPSITRYEVLDVDLEANTTRIKLIPITGRSHQLRVHLLSINHMICSDALYSGKELEKGERLLLHANKIEFRHPTTLQNLLIESPCPF